VAGVIVVGAGAGGLAAAGYLSRLGHEVLVLEASSRLGGCASGFSKQEFTFQSGASRLWGLAPGLPLDRVLEELGVALPREVVDLGPTIWTPEGCLNLDAQDMESTEVRLDRVVARGLGQWWSEAEALGLDVAEMFMGRATRPRRAADLGGHPGSAWMEAAMVTSAARSLSDAGCMDPAGLALVDQVCQQGLGAPASQVPMLWAALALKAMAGPHHAVPGGASGLMQALAGRVGESGARIRTRTRAVSVTADGDGYMVATERETFPARGVVLDLTPWDAARLCRDEPRAFFARQASTARAKGACCLYLGVADALGPCMTPHHLLLLDGPLRVSRARSMALTILGPPFAPRGYLAMTASCPAELGPWKDMDPARDVKGFEDALDEVIVEMLDALQENFPLLRSAETRLLMAAAPPAWERMAHRDQGRVQGLAVNFDTLKGHPPSGATPWPGLHRCGDTTFPGRNLAWAAWSGRRAALNLHKGMDKTG
jgi:phytoene dehydrogenase-like protein